tara:strand:+ start:508 stop:780 length:273 start_codon:yes stop_codon:yes gene_type:complete
MDKNILNEIIDDIRDNPHNSKDFYTEKYPDFSKHYPTLFEKLFDPKLDVTTLRYMLNQKEKMSSNKLSQHDASVKVGTMLVDKYVKPNLA